MRLATFLILRLLVIGVAVPTLSQAPPAMAHRITASQRPSVALAGRVTDAAHILDAAQEESLTKRLAQFEQATGHQIVVVTVPTLGGQNIKTFTTRLANAWRIGRAKQNDGVVILVAPHERMARIAVGYGLERQLTDATYQSIMQRRMVPRFQTGDMAGGIDGGVDAIIDRLRVPREFASPTPSRPRLTLETPPVPESA